MHRIGVKLSWKSVVPMQSNCQSVIAHPYNQSSWILHVSTNLKWCKTLVLSSSFLQLSSSPPHISFKKFRAEIFWQAGLGTCLAV